MLENKIQNLARQVSELEELRLSMVQLINNMDHSISDVEKSMDEKFQLSFLLKDIKYNFDSLNLDQIGENISELEDKIYNLSYNYKKASEAQEKTFYKVQNLFANPMYINKNP